MKIGNGCFSDNVSASEQLLGLTGLNHNIVLNICFVKYTTKKETLDHLIPDNLCRFTLKKQLFEEQQQKETMQSPFENEGF